jgi:hypothetical protein
MDERQAEKNHMGVFGFLSNYTPRYGLWITADPECQRAVEGFLSEGFDCDVVLKYGMRCAVHAGEPHRPIIKLSEYKQMLEAGELEPNACTPPDLPNCYQAAIGINFNACYIREVFFPQFVKIIKRNQ